MGEEVILGTEDSSAATESTVEASSVVTTEETKDEPQVENTSVVTKDEAKDETPETKDSKPDEVKDVAPEKYEDFTLPEGMEVDENLLNDALPVFKELNLTQDQAQKLVDLQAKTVQEEVTKQQDAWKDTMKEWGDQTKSDKEFGGTKFDESLVVMKQGIEAFGNAEFKQMLDITGVGNHPEMARFLFKVGQVVKEHNILHGSSNATGDKSSAVIMFPNMNQ